MIESKKLTENDIQNLILDYLNKRGIFAFRINNTGIYDPSTGRHRKAGKFSLKGIPDIMGILPPGGRVLGIEVKTPKGIVSQSQKAFINKINKNGGLAFVARSLDQVIDTLKREGL